MPHLRFRGFDEAKTEAATAALLPELSKIIGCPEDWFSAECVHTRFLTKPALPTVEVVWFARDQSVQDAAARAIHEATRAAGETAAVVMFIPVSKSDYYENGERIA